MREAKRANWPYFITEQPRRAFSRAIHRKVMRQLKTETPMGLKTYRVSKKRFPLLNKNKLGNDEPRNSVYIFLESQNMQLLSYVKTF